MQNSIKVPGQFRGMVSGFANATLAITLALGLLGGLFASPAEAVVKTYYAQEDGSCGANYGTGGNVWKPAAEGNSGSCNSRSTLGGRWGSGTRDMLIAYTPPYASQTTITGQAGSNVFFNETGRGSFTGRVRFVEINAAGDTILGNLTGEVTTNVPDSGSANITDLSTLSGTINAGNRLGMVVAITNPDAEAFTYFGDNGGGASNEAWFVVDEVPVCSESITSSIIWNGTNSATGDFNGSSFITANDVNTLQYQVTEGGSPVLGTDTFFYNGDSNFSSPVTVAGTTTNVVRSCSTGGNSTLASLGGAVPQIASAGGAWDSCADNRYRHNGTGPVQWIMADTAYGADTVVTGRSNTPINFRASNGNSCSIQLNLGYVSSGTFTSFGSSPIQTTTSASWATFQFDLSGVSGTVPVGSAVAVEVDVTANSGDCRFAYGSNIDNSSVESGTFTVDTQVAGETTVIPWTADPIPAIANLTNGNTYNLYARGTEAECAVDTYYGDPSVGNTTADGVPQSFIWSSVASNTAPTITSNASTSATEDIQYTYNPTFSDPDGPGATWSKLPGDTCPSSTINSGTGAYAFTAAGPSPISSCTLSIQICDGGTPNQCDSETVTVNVTAVDDASTLTISQPSGQTVTAGDSFDITYTLSDPEGTATVTFYYDTIGSGFSGTAITGCANQVAGTNQTCAWNTSGMEANTYHVFGVPSDSGSSAYSVGTLTIDPSPNAAPTIDTNAGTTATEDIQYTYNPVASDSDGPGPFTWSKLGGDTCPSSTINSSTGAYAFTAAGPNPISSCTLSIQVCDGGAPNQCDSETVTVNVTAVDDASTLTISQPSGQAVTAGTTFNITYTLSDPEGNATVTFYYDTIGSGFSGTAISGCANQVAGTNQTCTWDTSGLPGNTYHVFGVPSDTGSSAYSAGALTISVAALSYVSGDDGTNPGAGDRIAGISRVGGGDDSNNLVGFKPKIDVEYEFSVNFIDDSGESPVVEPVLYIAHRDSPTEGAGGDFFVYPLVCTGVAWGSGKTCSTTMKLGPAASHKFYFYAEKTDGTPARLPSSGYTDGPAIWLIVGYSLVGASRDINSSSLGGSAAFNSPYSYEWDSTGLDTDPFVIFNGDYVAVTDLNPAKAGKGYFVYAWSNTLPQLGSNADVTAASHTITLQPGWNIISNPYNGNVELGNVQIRRNGSTTDTWSNAAGSNWIEPAIYYYQGSDWGGTYAPEFAPGAELVPWMGYWMYVKDDVNSYELIITKAAQ